MPRLLAGWLWLSAVLAARAADPAEKDKNYQTAAGLLKAGNYDAAVLLLDAAAKDCPASLLIAYARGFIAEKAGKPADALAQYRYALIIGQTLPQPDETQTRTVELVRTRLREVSPATTLLLAKADALATQAKALQGDEQRVCEAAANDLRQLALGQVEIAPAATPDPGKPPAVAAPGTGDASGPALEKALGYRLSGVKRVKEHPDARKFGGHWYKFMPGRLSWTAAGQRCQEMGGFLACITSKGEEDLIVGLVGKRTVWLGAADVKREGDWQWVTGEPFEFKAWSPNQPDNFRGEEHYLTYNGHGMCWNDLAETHGSIDGFVCEWDR